ncbi:MAG: nitronate monooxygenase family protein, partial [Sphingomonadales bacterium]
GTALKELVSTMTLPIDIRQQLVLPAVCAPMMIVSGPELVSAACRAGLVGGIPAHNARDRDELEAWLASMDEDFRRHRGEHPDRPVGPLAVNLIATRPDEEISATLDLCRRFDVRIIISAMGNPAELVKRAHDQGAAVYHDVVSVRHAESAIRAGVDGLTCIGAGGGGHAGAISHLVLIPRIRSMFDGTIILAGAASNGAAIRAAEILGADLCYLGTRFIATREARAPDVYKRMLVDGRATDLNYTPNVSGVSASWLKASLAMAGLDPENPPAASAPRNYDHLPAGVRPWRDLWSAGQGIELIDDVPAVADLVARLCREYVVACRVPDMADAAGAVAS